MILIERLYYINIYIFLFHRSIQRYTFVKIEKGYKTELADKLAKYDFTLRQYRQSLSEEILSSRVK